MEGGTRLNRIRELLEQGHGMDTVVRIITGEYTNHDRIHDIVVEEKAKIDGTYMTVPATPAAVAEARDSRDPRPRWKMLAAMVYGDAGSSAVRKVRELYEREKGPGSASASWTGRGAPPSGFRG